MNGLSGGVKAEFAPGRGGSPGAGNPRYATASPLTLRRGPRGCFRIECCSCLRLMWCVTFKLLQYLLPDVSTAVSSEWNVFSSLFSPWRARCNILWKAWKNGPGSNGPAYQDAVQRLWCCWLDINLQTSSWVIGCWKNNAVFLYLLFTFIYLKKTLIFFAVIRSKLY